MRLGSHGGRRALRRRCGAGRRTPSISPAALTTCCVLVHTALLPNLQPRFFLSRVGNGGQREGFFSKGMGPAGLRVALAALLALQGAAQALTPEQAHAISNHGDSDTRLQALGAAVAAADPGLPDLLQALLADEVKLAGGKAFIVRDGKANWTPPPAPLLYTARRRRGRGQQQPHAARTGSRPGGAAPVLARPRAAHKAIAG